MKGCINKKIVMEKIIFYNYLGFINKRKTSILKKINSAPKRIYISFITIYLFGMLSFVSQRKGWGDLYTLGFLLLSIVCCFLMSHFIEKYDIKRSQGAKKELESYCVSFKEFLSENGIVTNEAIKLLYTRLSEKCKKMEEHKEKHSENIFKWLQTIVVPLILVFISGIISLQKDLSELLEYSIIFFIVILFVFGTFFLLKNLMNFNEKKKNIQMSDLLDDLQLLMDMDIYFASDDSAAISVL